MTHIDASKATALIHELISAEVVVVNQENTRHGGVSKVAGARELRAVRQLFEALTGYPPTVEQLSEMCGG